MYKITLADGTTLNFDGMNGTNYIVPDKQPMDVSVFTDENLKSGTVEDDEGNIEEFQNWAFISQYQWKTGDYYVCFRQKSDQEVADEERDKYISHLELALVELCEATDENIKAITEVQADLVVKGVKTIEEVPESMREEVSEIVKSE